MSFKFFTFQFIWFYLCLGLYMATPKTQISLYMYLSHLMRLLCFSFSVDSFFSMHAQPSSGARCLSFGQTLRLLPYFMCANSQGSGETAWAFPDYLCGMYNNLMSCLICNLTEPQRDKTNKMSVHPAKTQISLDICPVWSESSLCTYSVAKDPSFLHACSEDSDQTERMPRLIWVFAGCTLTLLVLSCRGSTVYGGYNTSYSKWIPKLLLPSEQI